MIGDIDATKILPGLYIGGEPLHGYSLRRVGFDTLVCCAIELQKSQSAERFPGVEVLYCPMDDANLTSDGLKHATVTARLVSTRVRHEKRVLVTCQQGRNRSGLVVSLAVHLLTGWAGERCVDWIQRQRKNSLMNPSFMKVLRELPAGLPERSLS